MEPQCPHYEMTAMTTRRSDMEYQRMDYLDGLLFNSLSARDAHHNFPMFQSRFHSDGRLTRGGALLPERLSGKDVAGGKPAAHR